MKNYIAFIAMTMLLYTNAQNHRSSVDPTSTSMNGQNSTATGYFTLYYNTGYGNTANGIYSLFSNNSGELNTATGFHALTSNISGSYNTSIGSYSSYYNKMGSYNTSIGYQALFNNNNGSHNTAVGYQALFNAEPADYNSAYGPFALWYLYNGHYNTANGYKAMASVVDATNQTVIGYEATGQADNSVVLGNDEVTAVYMGEDSGAKIYAGDGDFSGELTIDGDIHVSSDARLKANIMSLGSTLAKLMLIDGKTYTTKRDGKQKIGVLAQDIQNVFPELVSQDDDEMLAVNYQGLIPILINALKEQDAKISRLEQLTKQLITNE